MIININESVCDKYGTSKEEILALGAIQYSRDEDYDSLIKNGYITKANSSLFTLNKKFSITPKGAALLNSVVLDSDKDIVNNTNFIKNIAEGLKEIFPKGKKDGTNYYWAEGVALIERRLKLFFKKYGKDYTEDQILQAAKKYVESFNGNYQYMKLLKYFIFKEKVGVNGEVEGDSELLNYIENAGQEENLRNDWTSELR